MSDVTEENRASKKTSREHSFFSFVVASFILISLSLSVSTLDKTYLAQVAEEHALPVGCSSRFHDGFERQ